MGADNSLKKRRLVKFMTALGDRCLEMKPVVNMTGPEEVICETRCPYSKVCKLLPDPRKPESEAKPGFDGFLNFCGDLGTAQGDGEEQDIELANYVPCEGSIEKTFEDRHDILNIVIKANPSVKVKDVIEHACRDWCPDWSEDYHNCNSSNMTCILRGLFSNDKAMEENLKNLAQFEEEAAKKSEELTKEAEANDKK